MLLLVSLFMIAVLTAITVILLQNVNVAGVETRGNGRQAITQRNKQW